MRASGPHQGAVTQPTASPVSDACITAVMAVTAATSSLGSGVMPPRLWRRQSAVLGGTVSNGFNFTQDVGLAWWLGMVCATVCLWLTTIGGADNNW